jgi:hypothetical protein
MVKKYFGDTLFLLFGGNGLLGMAFWCINAFVVKVIFAKVEK